jgi:hypothetical protein
MPDPLEQARAAKAHSRQGFLDAVDLGVEARKVIEALQSHYRENHFGDGLDYLWRTRKGKT